MKAWHFLKDDGSLQWKCGNTKYPKVGQTLKVNPDRLELCSYGLHASKRLLDALQYAPGATVCRVELGGRILEDTDKVVASERTVLQMADAADVLHEFACRCAEDALQLIESPDPRSIAAIKAKRQWLKGEIGDEELQAAWAAARAAAWAAAWAAASDAARAKQNRRLTSMITRLLQ